MRPILIAAGLLCANVATADGLIVQFTDGAPKDSLILRNTGCPLSDATIVFDLRDTPAGLIFDVTASGAGVEVFQPVEAIQGDVVISPVADGGQVLHLHVANFPSGDTISLTADLDDTRAGRQITVSGSEMIGAKVSVAYGSTSQSGAFNAEGIANVQLPATADGCLST